MEHLLTVYPKLYAMPTKMRFLIHVYARQPQIIVRNNTCCMKSSVKSSVLRFHRNSFIHFCTVLQSISSRPCHLIVRVKKQHFFKCFESRIVLFLLLIGITKVVPSCDIAWLNPHSCFELFNSLVKLPIAYITDPQRIVSLYKYLIGQNENQPGSNLLALRKNCRRATTICQF